MNDDKLVFLIVNQNAAAARGGDGGGGKGGGEGGGEGDGDAVVTDNGQLRALACLRCGKETETKGEGRGMRFDVEFSAMVAATPWLPTGTQKCRLPSSTGAKQVCKVQLPPPRYHFQNL